MLGDGETDLGGEEGDPRVPWGWASLSAGGVVILNTPPHLCIQEGGGGGTQVASMGG